MMSVAALAMVAVDGGSSIGRVGGGECDDDVTCVGAPAI